MRRKHLPSLIPPLCLCGSGTVRSLSRAPLRPEGKRSRPCSASCLRNSLLGLRPTVTKSAAFVALNLGVVRFCGRPPSSFPAWATKAGRWPRRRNSRALGWLKGYALLHPLFGGCARSQELWTLSCFGFTAWDPPPESGRAPLRSRIERGLPPHAAWGLCGAWQLVEVSFGATGQAKSLDPADFSWPLKVRSRALSSGVPGWGGGGNGVQRAPQKKGFFFTPIVFQTFLPHPPWFLLCPTFRMGPIWR